MKKGGSMILIIITGLFAAFTGGVLLGRSLDRSPVSVQPVITEYITSTHVAESGDAVQDDGKININTASAVLLDSLPGIGPVLAQRIVDHRTANGPFSTIEELSDVEGIGSKILLEIFDQITVGD